VGDVTESTELFFYVPQADCDTKSLNSIKKYKQATILQSLKNELQSSKSFLRFVIKLPERTCTHKDIHPIFLR